MAKILIKQKRSVIGCENRLIKIMQSMGFRKKSHVGSKVVHEDSPSIRGKINFVNHLVTVEKV